MIENRKLLEILRPYIKERGPEGPTFKKWLTGEETTKLFNDLFQLVKGSHNDPQSSL